MTAYYLLSTTLTCLLLTALSLLMNSSEGALVQLTNDRLLLAQYYSDLFTAY